MTWIEKEKILRVGGILLLMVLFSTFAYAATSIELTTGNFINVFGNLNLSGNNLVNAGNVSIRGNLSVDGNVSVDGSTLFVDATSNNVGIGTTSPNYLLQTASGTDGRSVNLSNVLYVNGSSGNVRIMNTSGSKKLEFNLTGLEVIGSDNSQLKLTRHFNTGQYVVIGEGGADFTLRSFSSGTHSQFSFISDTGTASLTRLFIDSSGNVGIGTTGPAATLHSNGTFIHSSVTNSTTAFQVKSKEGSTIFDVDTTNGNVGIGTTSPSARLAIHKDGPGNLSMLKLGADTTVNHGDLNQIEFWSKGPLDGSNVERARIALETFGAGTNGGSLTFWTATGAGAVIEKMRIDKDGNVGIGTTGPAATLQINGAGDYIDTAANRIYPLELHSTDNTNFSLLFGIEDGSPGFGWIQAGNPEFNRPNLVLQPEGGETDAFVGIGTKGPETTFHVNRSTDGVAIRVQDSDNFKCDINPGSGADWSCTSDAHLKKNVRDLDSSLDKIMGLKIRKFELVPNNKTSIGFVAQEVHEVIPEMVDTKEQDNWKISTGPLIPIMVKAIQEQQEQITELKTGKPKEAQQILNRITEVNGSIILRLG